MFEWLFGKKKNNDIKELIKVLKNGINININISGNLNVEQERGNTLETRPRPIDPVPVEAKKDSERTRRTQEFDTIPDLKKLSKPEVNFGKETEV